MSVPASVVQDGLLDLWGHLPEGETRTEVERWLTETLERSLYSVARRPLDAPVWPHVPARCD